MAPNDFNGEVALVTGSGSGMGRATCLQLARDGARVVVTDINLEAARQTLSLLPDPGTHLALQLDVTQQKAAEDVIAAARSKFGVAPSLLVNCAGILEMSPFLDVKKEGLDKVIDINIKGTFFVTQVFVKALLEEDRPAGEGRGAVVNIASIAGKVGFAGASHYAATKGAVIAFTKTCATELARKGIRVNCVLPGVTDTPLIRRYAEEVHEVYMVNHLLGRLAVPEEMAEMIVFLLSKRSSYMVGSCVEVTGGLGM